MSTNAISGRVRRLVTITGMCLGLLLTANCSGDSASHNETNLRPEDAVSWGPDGHPVYPTNAKGQSFGSNYSVPLEDESDLIAVEATNGVYGYVFRDDLNQPDPASPEEAVAGQRDRDKRMLAACLGAIGFEIPTTVLNDELAMDEAAAALYQVRLAYASGQIGEGVEVPLRDLFGAVGNEELDPARTAGEIAALCSEAGQAAIEWVLPVFESDGETVVGEFVVG